MKRNPFSLPSPKLPSLQTLSRAMKESLKEPPIGVTQGGSSRKDKGARVAATISHVKQPQGN